MHRENNCQVPFCKECWKVIKANITEVKGVADRLLQEAEKIRKPKGNT